jgi:hypothetical protein
MALLSFLFSSFLSRVLAKSTMELKRTCPGLATRQIPSPTSLFTISPPFDIWKSRSMLSSEDTPLKQRFSPSERLSCPALLLTVRAAALNLINGLPVMQTRTGHQLHTSLLPNSPSQRRPPRAGRLLSAVQRQSAPRMCRLQVLPWCYCQRLQHHAVPGPPSA